MKHLTSTTFLRDIFYGKPNSVRAGQKKMLQAKVVLIIAITNVSFSKCIDGSHSETSSST